jgi:hypothetical protein
LLSFARCRFARCRLLLLCWLSVDVILSVEWRG